MCFVFVVNMCDKPGGWWRMTATVECREFLSQFRSECACVVVWRALDASPGMVCVCWCVCMWKSLSLVWGRRSPWILHKLWFGAVCTPRNRQKSSHVTISELNIARLKKKWPITNCFCDTKKFQLITWKKNQITTLSHDTVTVVREGAPVAGRTHNNSNNNNDRKAASRGGSCCNN